MIDLTGTRAQLDKIRDELQASIDAAMDLLVLVDKAREAATPDQPTQRYTWERASGPYGPYDARHLGFCSYWEPKP